MLRTVAWHAPSNLPRKHHRTNWLSPRGLCRLNLARPRRHTWTPLVPGTSETSPEKHASQTGKECQDGYVTCRLLYGLQNNEHSACTINSRLPLFHPRAMDQLWSFPRRACAHSTKTHRVAHEGVEVRQTRQGPEQVIKGRVGRKKNYVFCRSNSSSVYDLSPLVRKPRQHEIKVLEENREQVKIGV